MPPVPDLVHLSRLQVEVSAHAKEIRQFVGATGTSPGRSRRRAREEQTWQREKQLGRGGFGTVILERCTTGTSTGTVRAVKELRKAANINYHRELEAAALFSHARYEDNFVKSFGWYETADCIYMTMEYLSYGDLQHFVGNPFPEIECQLILTQVFEALDFMHERGFTHRDLKPPNILVSTPGPDWWIKLSDFGISKRAEAGVTSLHTPVFTPGFAAPEIFFMYLGGEVDEEAAYTEAVDIWSAGIVALLLLSTETIFDNRRTLLHYCKGKHDPLSAALARCSIDNHGKDLVQHLLAPQPQNRPSAKQCLKKDWLMNLLGEPEMARKPVHGATLEPGPSVLKADDSSYFEPSGKWSEASGREETLLIDGPSRAFSLSIEPAPAASTRPGQDQAHHFSADSVILTASEEWWDAANPSAVEEWWDLPTAAPATAGRAPMVLDANNDKYQGPEPESSPGEAADTSPGSKPVLEDELFKAGEAELDVSETHQPHVEPEANSRAEDILLNEPLHPTPGAFATLSNQSSRDSGYASVELRAWRDSVVLSEDTEPITTLAFCADWKCLVSAAANNVLRVWNFNSARLISTRKLPKRSSAIEHIAISPDGETMATRSEAGQILLWDLVDGEAEPTIQLASRSEYGSPPVTFSPDGRFVAWIDLDGAVIVRDVVSGTLQTTVTHTSADVARLKGNVSTFAFSPNNKYILSGSEEGSSDPVSLWSLHTGGRIATLCQSVSQDLAVWQVSFSGACHMAAALGDSRVMLWDSKGQLLCIFNSDLGIANDLAFSPDCDLLAMVFDDTTRIWDMAQKNLNEDSLQHKKAVEALKFSPDGKFLATVCEDAVELWDVKRRRLRFLDDQADLASRGCFAFSPDGQILSWGGVGEIRMLDLHQF